MNHDYLWYLLALPLLGSAISGTLHLATLRARRANPNASGPAALAGVVASGAMLLSFGIAVRGFLALGGHGEDAVIGLESSAWDWIDAGSVQFSVSLVLDRLSSVLALVVTGVGLLIHVYSTGYMKGDPGYAKFFAYLNLFVTAMMTLILSSNLLGVFIGWEGVGLCSYLLIGFWYDKGWPAEAGQKAFVVNRVGDASFLIGSFLLIHLFGTLDLSDIGASVAQVVQSEPTLVTLAALLLFGGACGKSAQFPLFTWLPDAMAGPTPVSALIHAATMVTAGVYLIARLAPLFAASPIALSVIGIVGALTALIGATTALRQNDIKKVLAYSTVSQLGFMFMALAAGAWAAAVFHLVTHAFFKGLLFLGSGSVIHGMHEEQDMRKMGGLRKHMPKTYATFLAGAAALSGLPLMSGYWSKDEILAMDYAYGPLHKGLWAVGLVAAAFTAFYTWRMVAMTFFGKERFDPKEVHPHESPSVMWVPLAVLAVLSVFGGILNLPPVFPAGIAQKLHHWLEPVMADANAILAARRIDLHLSHALEWSLLGLGALIALVFAHRGFHAYRDGYASDDRMTERSPALAGFLGRAWGIDGAYQRGIVEPVKAAAVSLYSFFDQLVIDGLVNGVGHTARAAGMRLRSIVDGNVKTYALWMGAGAACLTLLWIAIDR
jgi:NADH-quinone oxidoreductase subunit L